MISWRALIEAVIPFRLQTRTQDKCWDITSLIKSMIYTEKGGFCPFVLGVGVPEQ